MSQKQSKKKRGQYQVILINDQHNTFEHVINCLIDICGHNYYQAVQCATITHGVGQCSLYVDTYDECDLVWQSLHENGLNVVISKYTANHV